MQPETATVRSLTVAREPEMRIVKVNSGPAALPEQHDDDGTRRDDQPYLEDACSYDLFDLQDSGLVAA